MKSKRNRTRVLSIGMAVTLVASAIAFGVMSSAPDASAIEWSPSVSRLGAARPAQVKITTQSTVVIQTSALPKQKTEIATKVATTSSAKTSSTRSSSTGTAPASGGTSELAKAQSILAGLISRYPILQGSTVTIGTTPNNYQAVCYYKSGRIIVSPTHKSSLSTILNHEVWHIIDWRDNGVIDWGESVPRG